MTPRSRLVALRMVALLTISVVAPPPALAQMPREWTPVSEFVASGLHAWGQFVAAWNQHEVTLSRDGGLSWSPPVMPGSHAGIGVRQVASWKNGVAILLADGRMVPGSTRANLLAVDGRGQLFIQTLEGQVEAQDQSEGTPSIAGTILAPLSEGVLLRLPEGSLAVLRPGETEILAAQPIESLPRFFMLAHLTGGGSNRILERDGRAFSVQRRSVSLRSERPVEVLSHWEEGGIRYELIRFQGQLQIQEYSRIERAHLASHGIPADTNLLSATSQGFVAVTSSGIWVRSRN